MKQQARVWDCDKNKNEQLDTYVSVLTKTPRFNMSKKGTICGFGLKGDNYQPRAVILLDKVLQKNRTKREKWWSSF